jgi:hypothetical protein
MNKNCSAKNILTNRTMKRLSNKKKDEDIRLKAVEAGEEFRPKRIEEGYRTCSFCTYLGDGQFI